MKYLLQLLIITIVLIVTSCASEVGDIDRTQPNKLKKSFFDGEWYMRTTVVDVPFNTGFTFIGEQGDTTLVQWDIQENYLIAYRTYEFNPGTESYVQGNKTYGTVCKKGNDLKVLGFNQDCPEGYDLESKEAFQGTPVAAYAISSHFDVKRQYNSSTGEQTNVITENTSDRHWYERDYIRVRWGSNLISDFRFGSPTAIPQQGVEFYCAPDDVENNDPLCEKWAPEFDEENGYMSIVTKILANPETFNYYGTKYPTCYLSGAQDCLGQELAVKTDFMKKTDKQYAQKPVEYDETKMKKFGYFRTEKYVYDKDRGFLEGARTYYANVFDIFERDENGEFTGTINPIVYYVNKDFPPHLWQAVEWLASGKTKEIYHQTEKDENGNTKKDENGNDVLKKVERLGWNDVYKDLASEVLGEKYQGEDVFVVCHNPVTKEDHEYCGEPGLSPRIGDIRYNLIFMVNNPQAYSPLGYGPLSADPLTGITISANAFVYGNALEGYAQYVLELVDLVNGKTDIDDYISGRYIAKYLNERNLKTNNLTFERKSGYKFLGNKINPKLAAEFASAKLSEKLLALKENQTGENHFNTKMSSLKGSHIDKMLMNRDMKALINPSKDFVDAEGSADDISAIDIMSGKFAKRDAELRRILAKKTIMMADFNEASLLALAKYIADRLADDWTRQDAFDYIEREIFYGTTIHEVGHNLGLRHNFASHTDSLNFFEEYWDIRIGDATQLTAQGVLPRYLETDAKIKEQMNKGILEYQYSSIMDYGGRSNTDFQGLGKYDKAAIMFAYGDKVEVFDNKMANGKFRYTDKEENAGLNIWRNNHYSRILYPQAGTDKSVIGGLIKDVNDPGYVNNKELNMDFLFNNRRWVNYKEVLFDKNDPEVKANSSLYLKDRNNDDIGSSDGLVEVPYAFCSDEYHAGNYKCYRFALGVDMYESVMHQQEYYENWYFLTNFKKGKSFFSEDSYGYMRRIHGRFFFIANQFKQWYYEVLVSGRDINNWALDGVGSRFKGEDLTIAAFESVNFFTRVLGSVDPGFYTLNANNQYELTREKDYLNNWDEVEQAGEVEIKLGVGKYQESHYDTDLGYSYYYTPVIQGVWLDKVLALNLLGDERTNYMGVIPSTSLMGLVVSYSGIFGDDLMRTIAGVILDRPEYYAPFRYNGETHNPIGILGGNSSFYDIPVEGFDQLKLFYESNKANFQYIKPKNSLYVKYVAIINAFAYYSSTTGLDFEKSLEINTVDNGNSYTNTLFDDLDQFIKDKLIANSGSEAAARTEWENDTQVVLDPLSKRTYFAANIHAAKNDRTLPVVSIGYELLKDFKVLVDQYNFAKTEYDNDSANTAKYEAFDTARKALREKRDYIDLVVTWMYYLKHHDY